MKLYLRIVDKTFDWLGQALRNQPLLVVVFFLVLLLAFAMYLLGRGGATH
jgi:hypothetical protein